jgi:formylmethanofuran dehydrogenase subunit E
LATLAELFDASAALHHHLCPRQVLGVRMGLEAGRVLGVDVPQSGKRLLTIVETDGCASDGIAVATNCWVGRRTMRIQDYGKVAATFADTIAGQAVRIVPSVQARQLAFAYAPEARSRWEAQLLGYQRMPAGELLSVQAVRLNVPIEQILGCAGTRVICEICGEEIMNGREVVREEMALCASCAETGYYRIIADLAMPIVRPAETRAHAVPAEN